MVDKEKSELSSLMGVGQTTIDKLGEIGIITLMSLAVSSPANVAITAGLSEKAARKMINQARDELKLGFEIATEYAKKRELIKKIPSECESLDSMIDGGFESGCITEFFGTWGCLTGDTLIRISRGEKGHQQRIDWMFKQLHKREEINEHFKWKLEKPTYIRAFNGSTIGRHKILDVVYSGKKQVYELELENGYKLKATANHKILTDNGWVELQNLNTKLFVMCDTPHTRKMPNGNKLNILRDFCINHTKYHKDCRNSNSKRLSIHRAVYEANLNNLSVVEYINIIDKDEEKAKNLKYINSDINVIHHIDENHYNNNIENLKCLTKEEHLKLHGKKIFKNFNQGVPEFNKVKKITKLGIEDTYDIVCDEPYHNFNANDMIVHNSGKTQIAHLMTVKTLKENPTNKVVYVDTENTFRPERIKSFCEGSGIDYDDAMSRIFVARAYNAEHQILLVDELERLLQKDNTYRTLILDSLTSHFRAEFSGRGTLATRQQLLNKHMHHITKIIDLYNMVCIITNQVQSDPAQMYGDPIKAVGGNIVGHNSTIRIYLRRNSKGVITAKLIDSPNLPMSVCTYIITQTGIENET